MIKKFFGENFDNIPVNETEEMVKIDSALSKLEAIEAIKKNKPECPPEILESLELVNVKYLGFDGSLHEGQILIHHELQNDIIDLFQFARSINFPIESVIPISKFDDEDELSMSVNNSSGFNFRTIINQTIISLHGYGFAIDLNPLLNPVLEHPKLESGEEDVTAEMVVTQPKNGNYDVSNKGTLYKNEEEYHPIVKFLQDRGWSWGGDWTSFKDYQHFQKPLLTDVYLSNLQKYLENGEITQEQFESMKARATVV
jgi:hypothetical protein